MLDNLKCLEEAKGFQNRKTDDEAVGAGPLINFLFAGFKFKAPPTLSSSDKNKWIHLKRKKLLFYIYIYIYIYIYTHTHISITKTDHFTNFFLFQCREQLNKGLMLKAFVSKWVFFSSFDINDMHVETIFIEDLEKPLASKNCYFGLYIKT